MGALISIVAVAFIGGVFSFSTMFNASGTPTVHFADKPALLPVRKDDGSEEVEEISIKTLLETRCPSLFSEFQPVWWLPK
jgi:hypothetical protein